MAFAMSLRGLIVGLVKPDFVLSIFDMNLAKEALDRDFDSFWERNLISESFREASAGGPVPLRWNNASMGFRDTGLPRCLREKPLPYPTVFYFSKTTTSVYNCFGFVKRHERLCEPEAESRVASLVVVRWFSSLNE
jgi:hypothetical protein